MENLNRTIGPHEKAVGEALQSALADVERFNNSWAFMEARGAVSAAKKAIAKRDAAQAEVDRYRRILWDRYPS